MAYTTINKHTAHFNTKLYTGNGTAIGSGGNAITGVGFQPDFTWIKSRSGSSRNHYLYDAVRGVEKRLMSNQTNAEATLDESLEVFGTDGFTVGDHAHHNYPSETYASWNWKANGSGSANTDGNNITSTVSVNTTAGFSIVKYTGTGSASDTIGHGLGVKPAMVIMRPLGYTGAWWIIHKDLATDNVLEFNINAQANISGFGGGGLKYSTFTTSVIGGGNGSSNSDLWNKSGEDYIAYCFAEKTGYSKVGKYVGAGSNKPYIYTGFKPKFILIKCNSNTSDWQLFDDKRDGYNPDNDYLHPNSSGTEGTSDVLEIYSNGFRITDNDSWGWNKNTATYLWFAIGQSLVGSNNVPCTAR